MAGQSPASVAASKKGPALIPLGHHTGKPPIPLHRPVTVIGSRSNARIHLTSSTVSKAHALVVKDGPHVYIRDLASRTHVYVNGEKIRDQNLENGDLIKIGSFTFKFTTGQSLSDPEERSTPASSAKLEVSGADYPVPIDERVLLIGRRTSCDVHLLEESCSTAHAVIFEMNGARHVRDLGSRTGTYVNGVAVHQHQLNPGDHVRIGETTLTYTPSPELSIAAPESSAAGASALDLEVIDDTDQVRAAREASEREDVDLAPAASSKTSQLSSSNVPPASADTGLDAPPLSEAEENLSRTEEPAETAADASPAEGDEDALRPRRGWRPAAAATAGVSEETPADATDAEQHAPKQQDEDLLRIAPTESSTDEFEHDSTDAAAVLDSEPALDEPLITAGQFTDAGDDNAVDDLLDLVAEEAEDAVEQPAKPKRIDIDLSRASPPPLPTQAREAEPLESLDFSTLRGEGARDEATEAGEEVVEPIDVVSDDAPPILPTDKPAAAPSIAPSMRFDRDELTPPPLPTTEEPTAPAPTPKRGRKGKKSSVEKVAASRTRRKPQESVGEQPPDEQLAPVAEELPALDAPKESTPADVPLEPVAEVLEPTEPTPESALDLDAATAETATFDAATAEPSSVDQTSTDPLTDTGITRAVHDLTGDGGEIVEEPAAENVAPPELQPSQARSQDRGPVAPAAPLGEAKPPVDAKSYRWGANQENFLGGVPVKLPPIQPSSRRPAAPIPTPIKPPAHEPIEVTDQSSPIHLSADAPASDTSEQVDEVNALIDEILAPTISDSEVTTTKDDLLAHAPSLDSDDDATVTSTDDTQVGLPADLLDDLPPPLPMPPPEDAPQTASAKVHESHDPAQSRPVIPIPPPPMRGRRPARRTARAGAELNAPALREDERIPPYAGAASATVGRVTKGFDGLAMPPVREADVFSQMSPPATSTGEDPFSGVSSAPSPSALTPMDMVQAEDTPRARRGGRPNRAPAAARELFGATQTQESPEESILGQRRRPPVRPAIPGTTSRIPDTETSAVETPPVAARRPAVVMGEEDPDAAQQPRKRRVRWLVTIAILGLLLLGGANAAIQYFLVPSSVAQVDIRFRNYESLSIADRRKLQDDQHNLLSLNDTRIAARRLLNQSDPEIAPGFLDDGERYLATASLTFWPENRKGVMVLNHKGRSDPADRARLVAMGQALYTQNESRISDAKRSGDQLRDLKDTIARAEQEKRQLTSEIEQLRIQGDSAPDTKQINVIRDEVQQLEKAWGDALAAVKSAEAELARLKQVTPVQDSKNGEPAAPITDETLTAMEAQFKDLTDKLSAAQGAKAQQAAEAKRSLDASLEAFEAQLGQARELMKDSPELAAYVNAAQRLQETTRVVIDDIIRRQEQQYGRLNELKMTLTEKMEQRRLERLNGDPKLKELNERLATATRQLNAARNAGMQKEADDKNEEVKLLTNMIKSTEDMLPKDPAMKDYADTIAQIQSIIDTVQSNVEADRKRADQLLLDAQQTFAANAAVEKLPEAQKSVASNLEKQVADINAARQKYNTAISATATDDDESMKQLRSQAAALQAAIDGRIKDLADANSRTTSAEQEKARLDLIPLKATDLADLQKAEANARQAYTNREKDYRDAQAAAKIARDSIDRLTDLQGRQDLLDKKLEQARRDEQHVEEKVKTTVTLDPVTEADARETPEPDKRLYAHVATNAVILALLGGLMFFAMHRTSGGMAMPTPTIDDISSAHASTLNGANGSSPSNGDGQPGHHEGDDDADAEDSHPATV